MPSEFQCHVSKWSGGCGSLLCPKVQHMCFARGSVPARVLFVGEAPGESEDVLGRPFVGPAGRLLDEIVRRSVPSGVTCCFTNLVCCIPRDDEGKKTVEPLPEEVAACSVRLLEFIELVRPSLLVAVGAVARHYLDPGMKDSVWHGRRPRGRGADLSGYRESPLQNTPRCEITHPAAVLRANVAQQGLAVQRCVVTIDNAITDYVKL